MSEPSYLSGDPASQGNDYENVQEVECDCGWSGEVGSTKYYSHGVVTWTAEWKCPSCEESHTTEGEYDPSEDDEYEY